MEVLFLGNKSGKGDFVYSNGEWYKGNWYNDKKDGDFMVKDKTGMERRGKDWLFICNIWADWNYQIWRFFYYLLFFILIIVLMQNLF